MSDRLFAIEEFPEVPIFRPPARRKGEGDARFKGEYPPDWDRCTTCNGRGKINGPVIGYWSEMPEFPPMYPLTCPDCKGMGSLKARVRLEAGHRCVRCLHPYMPKGDAEMLSVKPSGLHPCERCGGSGRDPEVEQVEGGTKYNCGDCGGSGERWTPWSACDERCTHGGELRMLTPEGPQLVEPQFGYADVRNAYDFVVEAEWRILTVHHADGDKANVRWWNLLALDQRCHLEIQAKVVMERVYPFEHSEWFKDFVAGYYAWVYLGEELTREQVRERREELLGLERAA